MSHLLSFASRRTYTSHPNRTHLSSKQQPLFHRDLLRRSHFQCDRGKSSAYLPYSHPTQFPSSSPSPPPRIQLHTDHRTKLFRVTRTSHIRRSGGEQPKHACVRATEPEKKKKSIRAMVKRSTMTITGATKWRDGLISQSIQTVVHAECLSQRRGRRLGALGCCQIERV